MRNSGKGWEARILLWNQAYMRAERGLIIKTEPRVKVNHKGKPCAWAGKAPVDFVGTLDGRSVHFDAKDSSAAGRWSLSHVPDHQRRHLDRALVAGADAYILLRHPSGMWRLDWADIREQATIDPREAGHAIDEAAGWAPCR